MSDKDDHTMQPTVDEAAEKWPEALALLRLGTRIQREEAAARLSVLLQKREAHRPLAAVALAAESAAKPDWLAKPAVKQTAVNRFVVTAAHDESLTIEFEFQLPGSGQPLVLMQHRGEARDSRPARFGRHVIDFAGGVAAPEPGQVADLAASLKLPEAFMNWSELCGEFGRSTHRTSNRMRAAIASIVDAAKKALRTQADALHFLFGEMTFASRAPGEAEATAVVIGMERVSDRSLVVSLWWPEEGQASADAVQVTTDGQTSGPAVPADWIEKPRVLQLHGCAASPRSFASARLVSGVLQVTLLSESEA